MEEKQYFFMVLLQWNFFQRPNFCPLMIYDFLKVKFNPQICRFLTIAESCEIGENS